MLDYSEFKRILDLNSSLTEQLKTCPEEEREEIQMKLDSNVHALNIMADKIEDPEIRESFLNGIDTLTKYVNNSKDNNSNSSSNNSKDNNSSFNNSSSNNRSLINDELLKNSTRLRKMAEDFKMSLKNDDKILDRIGNKMTKNSVENSKSLQIFDKNGGFIKSSTFLSISLLIFVFTYFFIRFL